MSNTIRLTDAQAGRRPRTLAGPSSLHTDRHRLRDTGLLGGFHGTPEVRRRGRLRPLVLARRQQVRRRAQAHHYGSLCRCTAGCSGGSAEPGSGGCQGSKTRACRCSSSSSTSSFRAAACSARASRSSVTINSSAAASP